MKTLQEIIARLSEIDKEIRASQSNDELDKLEKEKNDLISRKEELENLEKRKQTALSITAGTASARTIDVKQPLIIADFNHMTPEEVRSTDAYKNAYLKNLMGRKLTDIEKRANEMGSSDVAGLIPTMTQNRIFDLIKQDSALLNEITLFQIPGNLTVGVEGTNADAAIHTQNASISPAADNMSYVTLGGYEIVKVNRISATVNAMAVSAFEQWLTANIARKLSRKMAYYCIYGTGSSQPKGVDYMNTWTDGTNAVDWAAASPTVAELVELVSYLKGGYMDGAKFLMKSNTFWGKIVAIQDNSKFKILTDDYKRLLGFPVLLDDNVATDDIFFGNFKEGMIGNISAPISVQRSEASGFLYNAIDYRGATLFDCDVTHTEGFVKSAATLTAGA